MRIALIISLLLISGVSKSQNIQTEEVKLVVENLFKGMYQGDSSLVHSCFSEGVRMFTTSKDDQGNDQLREGNSTKFLTAVGTPHDEVWDERIYNLKIDIDGSLAHAWMDYTFYLGDKLSHCGVNAMQLVRTDGVWKIISLIDTRRKSGCISE